MRSITAFAVISFLMNPFSTTAKTVTIRTIADAPFFDPTNTTAEVGDVLEFHFKAHNRSVVMGDYDNPCQPISTGGFYSGFFVEPDSTENTTVFRVTVNDTDPIVYYCSQNATGFGNHCKDDGMAGVINEPNLTKLQNYKDAAKLVNTSVSPASGPFGGVFAANPDAVAVNGTSTGSSQTSTPTSAAAIGLDRVNGCYLGIVAAVMGFSVTI